MSNDPEQQVPEGSPHRLPLMETSALPFDIDAFLAKRRRTGAWLNIGKSNPAEYSIHDLLISSNPPRARKFSDTGAWQVLTSMMVVLLFFGFIGYRVWSFLGPYPGTEQCHQIELWLHGVNSDLSRVRWALADAEEEVTNESEANAANDRIWQMYAGMRTSLARKNAPEEVGLLKVLWLQVLDLGFEIREADQKGDSETSTRLNQEQDEVITQRLEEERRLLHSCRLAAADLGQDQVADLGDHWNTQVALRRAF